jgi:hypothetical protein
MPAQLSWHNKVTKIYSPFEGGFSEEPPMTTLPSQQDNENGVLTLIKNRSS